MRIAFLNYHHDIEGTARGAAAQLRSMARALERRGHEVELVFRAARSTDASETGRSSGEPWWHASAPRRYGHVPRLVLRNLPFYLEECRLMDGIRPDLVLAVHQYCNVAPLLAAKRKGIPCVLFVETPMVYEYSLFYRDYHPYPRVGGSLEDFCVRHADGVICISEILKGYLTGRGASADAIHVIPNGVDETVFRPQPPDASLVDRLDLRGRKVVGFVGTFQFFTGLAGFMRVLESVCGRVEDAMFLFVGSGKPVAAIREEASRLGMAHRLRFTGAVPHEEVPGYLSVMDVAISPYRGDYLFYGSALKPLEYMAAGKALVAPALGQIKELVHDGLNGLLHDWDDDRAMGDAVVRVLKDPGLRTALGANARGTIEQGWTWDIQAGRMEAVFRKVLSRGP
ncbi:MAG: glycosyltransferase family 4 protein [Syntrophobacteraceae bacterium]|nr:glycosyltransferase family 4 protein [Syntrophobacteraceae bacterium]